MRRLSFSIPQLLIGCNSVWDCIVIYAAWTLATFADSFVDPAVLALPHPLLYSAARFAVWALYGFWAGLFATGLWVVAHECGHQAFSESKFINNSVGWVLHSACVSLHRLPRIFFTCRC